MANYNIDLLLTIKNSNKLKQLNKDFKKTNEEQKRVRQGLKEMDKGYKKFFPSLNKIVSLQSKAQEMFNKTALGTRANTMAAKDLVAAQRLLNHELAQRNKLLKEVRGGAFESGIVQNVGRSQRGRAGSGFASFSSRATEVTELAKTEAMKTKARDKHLKNIDKKVAKIATIQTQQQTQRAFSVLPGGNFGIPGGQIGPRLPIQNRLGFGKNAQGGPFAMPGGAMGRLKGGAGSALIGGGFPLLFGAGGLSSIMGGIAGAAGGALAPGGGFAASIAATAFAAQIEKAMELRKSLRKLNEEVSSMGISSEFSMKNIKALAREFDVTNEEAIKLASTVKTFGEKEGLGILQAFGSVETFRTLAGLRDTQSVLTKIEELQGEISEQKRQELLNTLMTKGALKAQSDLQQAILDKGEKAFIKADKRQKDEKSKQRAASSTGMMLGLNNLVNERTDPSKLKQQFNQATEPQLRFLQNQIELNERLKFVVEFQAPTDELREMLNPMRQILDLSTAIRDGFEESFKGIIKGTMSVQDAFRNMLGRIADHFLDTAARLAAAQLQKGFLGLFSNLFSFGNTFGTGIPSGANLLPGSFGTGTAGGVGATAGDLTRHLAGGGTAQGGKSYLVGERGPEIFTPGVTGTVTPNHAMGGMNIVVNVDASGSSVEGDEQQGRELGRLISVAVQSELVQQKRPGGLLA